MNDQYNSDTYFLSLSAFSQDWHYFNTKSIQKCSRQSQVWMVERTRNSRTKSKNINVTFWKPPRKCYFNSTTQRSNGQFNHDLWKLNKYYESLIFQNESNKTPNAKTLTYSTTNSIPRIWFKVIYRGNSYK